MAGKKYEVYVQKGRPVWKIITGILFSHMGLFVLAIGYGALGAYVFMMLERPGTVQWWTKEFIRFALGPPRGFTIPAPIKDALK